MTDVNKQWAIKLKHITTQHPKRVNNITYKVKGNGLQVKNEGDTRTSGCSDGDGRITCPELNQIESAYRNLAKKKKKSMSKTEHC